VSNIKSTKIDEDISKGLIKPMNREQIENEYVIGLTATASKKKGKGPKVSKREQKAENSNILNLDIELIKKLEKLD